MNIDDSVFCMMSKDEKRLWVELNKRLCEMESKYESLAQEMDFKLGELDPKKVYAIKVSRCTEESISRIRENIGHLEKTGIKFVVFEDGIDVLEVVE